DRRRAGPRLRARAGADGERPGDRASMTVATDAATGRHTARWIAITAGVVTLALIAVLATRPSAETALARSPLTGKPAPEIVGTAIDGRPVRLSALRGRYVLLNFFATWCIPCAREHG